MGIGCRQECSQPSIYVEFLGSDELWSQGLEDGLQ